MNNKTTRKDLKEYLLNKRHWECEGQRMISHECHGGLEMNEIFYPRNVFQKLPKSKQVYFWHEINCSLNCQWFHQAHGHSREWRDFWYDLQIERYGLDVVEAWVNDAPLKVTGRK